MPHPEQSAADTFHLLADVTRLRVMLILESGEMHVTAICQRVNQSQPAVSHHLALLRVSGLLDCRRDAKRMLYSLTARAKPLVKVARAMVPRVAVPA